VKFFLRLVSPQGGSDLHFSRTPAEAARQQIRASALRGMAIYSLVFTGTHKLTLE